MISRYEAWLNDAALSDIDPRIYVYDITYNAPETERTTDAKAGVHGVRIGKSYIRSNSVTIGFEVRAYSTRLRQEIIQQVFAWAREGGWLRTSDRPYQRLRVVCDAFPVAQSVMKWLDVLDVTFTAYEWPFWEEISPEQTSITTEQTSTLVSGSLYCPGSFEAPMEVTIVPTEGTMTEFSVAGNGMSMSFSGISALVNSAVKIGYTEDRHILTATLNNVSILDKRTAASVDDMILKPGAMNAIAITADALVTATFKVKGLTL